MGEVYRARDFGPAAVAQPADVYETDAALRRRKADGGDGFGWPDESAPLTRT